MTDRAASPRSRGRICGRTYWDGSLRLKSHVELHLEKGAVLLGSTKREDYDDFPRDECSVSPESSYRALTEARCRSWRNPESRYAACAT